MLADLAIQWPEGRVHRAAMHDFERLEVWRVAYRLALDLYVDTRGFPADERYGLVSQIRRCAASVPANIAEGSRRLTPGEFRNFLGVASGSNGELDVFLRFAEDLAYMSPEVAQQRRRTCTRVHHMLKGLVISLRPAKRPAR